MLDDALDRAILAAGVPALEDHQEPVAVFDDVALDLHELDLQRPKRRFVVGVGRPIPIFFAVLAHGLIHIGCWAT